MELMSEWLASTGFLFPTNELELARFEKLYGDEASVMSNFEVDCDRIFGKTLTAKVVSFEPEAKPEDIVPLKMVARKGSNLPKHIQDKIKKNQDERNSGANSGPEKGAE
ncbi:hypothetical protein KHS38_12975 [Mucilaginibacter sp. Bleaf8]|uniref:hypothetical protein n=1 Tax=Mucilaginibacter sp. Bleaf8 TaxID=2834430 RepID=UPI001BCCCAAD|nr:hypothetical protein [Mucilaginibacter sp. Bleaf8]MBS7565319.1 hypothetical protein [Mucilaginibacter sp. Bleaf8]